MEQNHEFDAGIFVEIVSESEQKKMFKLKLYRYATETHIYRKKMVARTRRRENKSFFSGIYTHTQFCLCDFVIYFFVLLPFSFRVYVQLS